MDVLLPWLPREYMSPRKHLQSTRHFFNQPSKEGRFAPLPDPTGAPGQLRERVWPMDLSYTEV